jgi:hypothetical protein
MEERSKSGPLTLPESIRSRSRINGIVELIPNRGTAGFSLQPINLLVTVSTFAIFAACTHALL